MEAIKKFLLDYLNLCLKYNIKISACGCCNSPYLLRNDLVDFVAYTVDVEHIEVDFENKCIEFYINGISYIMNLNGEIKEIKRW